jgi:hypothetical protein
METSDYSGTGDWHLELGESRAVRPRDRLEFSVEVQIESFDPAAEIFACIRVEDAKRRVIEERFAPDRAELRTQRPPNFERAFRGSREWRVRQRAFVGTKAARVLAARPALKPLRALANSFVKSGRAFQQDFASHVHPNEWRFEVRDKRSGHVWQTFPAQDNLSCDRRAAPDGPLRRLFRVYLPEEAPLSAHRCQLDGRTHSFRGSRCDVAFGSMPSWAATSACLPGFLRAIADC